jgi:hypothetical protein
MTAVAFIPALILLGTTILGFLQWRAWRRLAKDLREECKAWQRLHARTLDLVEQQSFQWPDNRLTIHTPKE